MTGWAKNYLGLPSASLCLLVWGKGSVAGSKAGKDALPVRSRSTCKSCHEVWGRFSLVPLSLVLHILSLV